MTLPHIALLTDFGTRDPYVASMRGVIASRTTAPVMDLSHEIAPHDVLEGAWFLWRIIPWLPSGTIVVAVVDPGVGTSRRIIAGRIRNCVVLAPDNGLLTLCPADETAFVSVEAGHLFLPSVSRTFHGRDRFAPVAAALAEGTVTIEALGPRAESIVRLPYQPPRYGDDLRGTVVHIDRYGNAITDLEVSRAGALNGLRATVGDVKIARAVNAYGEAGEEPFLIPGSGGTLEISLRERSAAAVLQISRLDPVVVEREQV